MIGKHIRISEENRHQVKRLLNRNSRDYLPWLVLGIVGVVAMAGVVFAML